jgi:hypothetical protein
MLGDLSTDIGSVGVTDTAPYRRLGTQFLLPQLDMLAFASSLGIGYERAKGH